MANNDARGFASMPEEKRREIASEGGKAAHEKGTAHEFTSQEAAVAGHKGGEAVSRDREHMAEIGREGGEAHGAERHQANSTGGQTSTRGGTSEQHKEAGSQSHKHDM
jgi:general stress protein YciG